MSISPFAFAYRPPMCMALGCNAAAVTGCLIIDRPRERLIAMLTNAFMPCNGRLPGMLLLIGIFFSASLGDGLPASLVSALGMTLMIVIAVLMTFLSSWLLSKTLLVGQPSAFTLELPPFRKPKVCRILIRSLLDRTLFVLLRAVKVAAPAGAVIWLLANTYIDGASLLIHAAELLEPLGRLMGMDGVILLAFVLAFPANELVLPVAIMVYTQTAVIGGFADAELGALLTANGWTWVTALCTMLFTIMHWPCGTTVLTIKKETGSWGYALLSCAIPTAFGVVACIAANLLLGPLAAL